MANRLILKDGRGYPWGRVEATIRWRGGGFSKAWISESGRGEFGGSGYINEIVVAGEKVFFEPSRVDGRTTVFAQSTKNH